MIKTLAVLAVCGAVATASAADNGVYLGLGASQSKFGLPGASDDKDNGLKAIAGFRALDSFGVELNYADHGKAILPTLQLGGPPLPLPTPLPATQAGLKSLSAFAVGFLDFPLLDLFAKVGVASWKFDVSAPGSGLPNLKYDGTDFAWGAGIQAHFGSLGARAEYEQFKFFEGQKLDVVSVSLLYTFL